MPDAVDRIEAVPHPDGVQATPLPGRVHPGVDLQMQVTMRIPRPGRVVPHRHRLELLDLHLHLPASRPDPGGRMLSEPADDLGCGAVLRAVVGGGDVRVQLGGQRPRLRAVHGHLDEAHRPVVVT